MLAAWQTVPGLGASGKNTAPQPIDPSQKTSVPSVASVRAPPSPPFAGHETATTTRTIWFRRQAWDNWIIRQWVAKIHVPTVRDLGSAPRPLIYPEEGLTRQTLVPSGREGTSGSPIIEHPRGIAPVHGATCHLLRIIEDESKPATIRRRIKER
jgi:hypothetical protein